METTESNPKEHKLAVLFVHGIGTQPSGETLIGWGDRLLKVLSLATNNKVSIDVGPARYLFIGNDKSGAEATVTIDDGEELEKWLLLESWWANAFISPTYFELVSWSIKALPWAITLSISQRYLAHLKSGRPLANIFGLLVAIFKLLLALALAPVFILFLLLVAILGILPIPRVRSTILGAQGTLVSTIGDSLAYVESPIRASMIRTRIAADLKYLLSKADKTVVVAHSQGAAVVLESLGGIESNVLNSHKKNKPKPTIFPDKLITFGAGINQLAGLKLLSEGSVINSGLYAVCSMISAGLLSLWLYFSETTLIDLIKSVGIVLLVLSIFLIAAYVVIKVLKINEIWGGAITVGLILIVYVVIFYLMDKSNLPIFGTLLLVLTVACFILSMWSILSVSPTKSGINVTKPAELKEWIEFYASDDPISNGSTHSNTKGPDESIEVYNYGSGFSDHTAYWNNSDGFVARVIDECANLAKSSWRKLLPARPTSFNSFARWRTRSIQFIRLMLISIAVTTFLVCWQNWHNIQTKIPLPPIKSIPESITQIKNWKMYLQIIGLLLIIGVGYLLIRLFVHFIWSFWVKMDQNAFFERKSSADYSDARLNFVFLLAVVFFFGWLSFIIYSTKDIPKLQWDLISGDAFAALFAGPVLFGWLWFKFAPKLEKTPDKTKKGLLARVKFLFSRTSD